MKYLPVIGLEIHLQVKTLSKMFCRCSSEYFGKNPNINICPVCFGLPGALPVPNKEAFNKAVKMAMALNCTIARQTKFDRKNYFYPDLPKGYQISQFEQPIGTNGYVEIELKGDSKRVRIQRLHLEEDTAKSLHLENNETLIDYNKSGVALIEIVTFPDFEELNEVILFAKRLKQIARYNSISDAEMQKGQMRFELNISVKPFDMPKGELPNYKVEVKNIGSISVLEKVLAFEFKRQTELLDKNEKITSQTRGLKGMTGETVFQRSKETSDDYRYFPEPDIPPIKILESDLNSIILPEQPAERKLRYINLGLELEQSDILVEYTEKGDWFDQFVKLTSADKTLIKEGAKWLIGDIAALCEKKETELGKSLISPQALLSILELLHSKKISGSIAKNVLEKVFVTGKDPVNIIKDEGLTQLNSEDEILEIAKKVVAENSKVVLDVAKNPNALKFLVGQVMKLTKGKANPNIAMEILQRIINKQ